MGLREYLLTISDRWQTIFEPGLWLIVTTYIENPVHHKLSTYLYIYGKWLCAILNINPPLLDSLSAFSGCMITWWC